MLDLYNSMSTEEKSDVDQYRSLFTTTRPVLASLHDTEFLHDADMVMSFVNLGKMNFYFILGSI